MNHRTMTVLLAASAAMSLAACDRGDHRYGDADNHAAMKAEHPSDPIESAMAAAPSSISGGATIVQAEADGSMKILRKGNNGWTCMPDSPTTPGPDPMCMDANANAWAAAWMGKKTPPAEKAGIMYMLAGGTDASNTDPYAKAPTQGGDWVKTGPHLMVVGSQAVLAGYPSGPKPDTTAPYVMWAGTPYAHLMIPVGD
ncbi:MAG TPA: hypothetical protein VHM92_06620 [Allosphingosinicella sp.]|nr:hypothetical protein [Allosphingosinicella sp.]